MSIYQLSLLNCIDRMVKLVNRVREHDNTVMNLLPHIVLLVTTIQRLFGAKHFQTCCKTHNPSTGLLMPLGHGLWGVLEKEPELLHGIILALHDKTGSPPKMVFIYGSHARVQFRMQLFQFLVID
ncbi:hypothetical protein MTR_4g084500 [Medicago truncatula]|uniref:Uncharacterized protein n=1 Tax=Medicago truncatula TaxID=3880 RepID=A0A072UMD0_MEDTR|nr:hypothetical protein MTR_4g084500 [Medicago truncatula]